jgi:hypothetical protein
LTSFLFLCRLTLIVDPTHAPEPLTVAKKAVCPFPVISKFAVQTNKKKAYIHLRNSKKKGSLKIE